VTIPASVSQRSEFPEGLMNYAVFCIWFLYALRKPYYRVYCVTFCKAYRIIYVFRNLFCITHSYNYECLNCTFENKTQNFLYGLAHCSRPTELSSWFYRCIVPTILTVCNFLLGFVCFFNCQSTSVGTLQFLYDLPTCSDCILYSELRNLSLHNKFSSDSNK
jgi:hypothetical protein